MFSHSLSDSRGFSLLEVLITAAIIGIVTAIVVVRYGSFNNSVLLKSQAYELALNIREAQVFAISVRGDSNEFREEFGIYFSTNSGGADANPNRYILFQDSGTTEPAEFDPGEEVGNPYLLDSRFEISDLCAGNDAGSCNSINEAHITFRRPDFDAVIVDGSNGPFNHFEVTINSRGSSETRTVVVTSTGQITVE